MSEIQRYKITTSPSGACTAEPTENGSWCSYIHVEFYRRQYIRGIVINIVVVLVCALIATIMVHEKAARGPVVVPMGAGEKASILRDVQAVQRQRDEYKALALNYKAQIKALTAKADGHVAQLEALQARGQEIDRLNKEQAQRMSTHQGVVMEAKRVLGVDVKVVE